MGLSAARATHAFLLFSLSYNFTLQMLRLQLALGTWSLMGELWKSTSAFVESLTCDSLW